MCTKSNLPQTVVSEQNELFDQNHKVEASMGGGGQVKEGHILDI